MAFGSATTLELTAIDNASAVIGRVKGASEQLGASYARLSGLLAGAGISAVMASIVRQASEAEQQSNRLTVVLRATGHSAGLTKRELDEMADSLSRLTQFEDEHLRAAEVTLLKFGNIQGNVFREAIKLTADYAAFIGTDLASAAQSVGRALQSPEKGLKTIEQEFGKLTPVQREAIERFIELNDVAGAQAVVLEFLQGKIGGAAEEMNTGLLGATKGVSKAWNEMLESIGKSTVVTGLVVLALELVKRTLEGLQGVVDAFSFDNIKRALTLDFRLPPAPDDSAAQDLARRGAAAAKWQADFERQHQVQMALVKTLEEEQKKGATEAAKHAKKLAEDAARERQRMIDDGIKSDQDAARIRWDLWQEEEVMLGEMRLRDLQAKQQGFADAEAALAVSLGIMYDMREAERALQGQRDLAAVNKRMADEIRAAEKIADARLAEEKRVSNEIERMIGDSIMRGFEAGKGWAQNFRDMLINLFKTLVLRPIIDPIAKAGANTVLDATGQATSGVNLLSGASNIASFAGSAGLWGSAAAGGVPVTSTFGAVASGAGYAGAGSTGLMGTLSTIPVAGWIAAAVVIAYAIFAKDGGGPKIGRDINQNIGGAALTDYAPSGGDPFKVGEQLTPIIIGQIQSLYSIAGKTLTDLVVHHNYELDPQGDAPGSVGRQIWVDGQRVSQFQNQVGGKDSEAVITALANLSTSEIMTLVEAIGDPTLSATVATLAANFKSIGLGQAVSQYTQALATQEQILFALLSPQEQLAKQQEQLAKAFADANMVMPSGIDGLRDLVSGLDLMTEDGQGALNVINQLGTAFLDQAEKTRQANQQIIDAAVAARQANIDQIRSAGEAITRMIAAIDEAAQYASAGFSDSIRSVQMSVLDDAGKYAFLDAEIANLQRQLEASTDYETTSRLASQINADIMAAWGLIPQDQQGSRADEFIAVLEDNRARAQDQFNANKAVQQTAAEANAALLKEAMSEALDEWIVAQRAIAEAQASAAAAQNAAGQAQLQAAAMNQNQTVTVRVDSSGNEVGA